MNICIIVGARPNFIKVAPLIRAIEKSSKDGKEISCSLVYAGKKNDPTLESTLFKDLEIREPDVYLGVDCQNLNELTGKVMSEFDKYLSTTPTDIVIVVDDLASTMAAAIVTKKHGIFLAHLVAGTRSFDIKMPKEINRLVIWIVRLSFYSRNGQQQHSKQRRSRTVACIRGRKHTYGHPTL